MNADFLRRSKKISGGFFGPVAERTVGGKKVILS